MLYKKRRKYKYNLHSEVVYETGIKVDNPQNLGLVEIDASGKLTVRVGYAWDGPSGPTIDTKTFMRGSLIHDALYQLIREGVLKQEDREEADNILKRVCLKAGMLKFRAWYVHLAVKKFAKKAAENDMLTAP